MKQNEPLTKKGYCVNVVNCPLADNGEIQEVPIGNDFKCSICGKELKEVTPKPKKHWMWILGCVVVIAAIVLLLVRGCCNKTPEPVEITDTTYNECGDTIVVSGNDTTIFKNTKIVTFVEENGDTVTTQGCELLEIKPYKKPESRKRDKSGNNDDEEIIVVTNSMPAYGNYSGPKNSAGEPHGKGGRVTITMEYHWNMRIFSPGDVIENTTYENGQLKHGRVVKKNGETYNI